MGRWTFKEVGDALDIVAPNGRTAATLNQDDDKARLVVHAGASKGVQVNEWTLEPNDATDELFVVGPGDKTVGSFSTGQDRIRLYRNLDRQFPYALSQ